MLQIYFLSVLLNVGGGLALISSAIGAKAPELRSLLQRSPLRISIGILAIAVGVAKLFWRAPFDTVAVAGDLLPVLTGLGVGIALLADMAAAKRTKSQEAEKVRKVSTFYRMPLAITGIAVGVSHFLFSSIVIL
jgi:hypothetical protein